jgi:DNA-binding IclR family transcriptional regulator
MAIRKKRQAGSAAQRALEILEAVATARRPVTGNEIMAWVKLPKPTVYRTCTLLETMGMVQREADSKKLTVGPRLCALALEVMLSSPNRGPIRAVLQSLASAIGETCTFTILDGNEVVVVDRVESAEPLRLELHAGSRIPLHCTASGKLFLSLVPRALSRRLIEKRAVDAPNAQHHHRSPGAAAGVEADTQGRESVATTRSSRMDSSQSPFPSSALAAGSAARFRSMRRRRE